MVVGYYIDSSFMCNFCSCAMKAHCWLALSRDMSGFLAQLSPWLEKHLASMATYYNSVLQLFTAPYSYSVY